MPGILHYLKYIVEKCGDKDYHELYPNYDIYHKEGVNWDIYRAEIFAQWIEKGSTILDAGCGDGSNARYTADKCSAKVEGIDISEEACRKAKEKGISVSIMDLNRESLTSLHRVYDYVLFCEVLEHLIRPHVALLDAARIVRKGIIVSFPNSAWLPLRVQLLLGYFPRQSFTHLHFWSHKDFQIFCKKLGLEIIDFKPKMPRGRAILKSLVKIAPNLLTSQLFYLISPLR